MITFPKRQIQYEYEQFCQKCQYFEIRPNYFMFLLELIRNKFDDMYFKFVAKTVCKRVGHKWKTESAGDAESGPITYTYCSRCGENETTFGM